MTLRASRSIWIAAVVLALAASARGQIVAMEGVYGAATVRFNVTFTTPVSVGSGWAFQLFIDSDDNRQTGYSQGFEKLVRGVEFNEPHLVDLRRTDGGGGPGGWGVLLTTVPFSMPDDRHLSFTVPVSPASGLVSGYFRYAFESYQDGRLQGGVYNRYTVAGTCTGNGDCDNGLFCDGAETCVGGSCRPGTSPCNGLLCDEGLQRCADLPCITSSAAWQNFLIEPQTGIFTIEYDAIPHTVNMDGLTGLSSGPATKFGDSAVTTRFNVEGYIDAFTATATNPWNPAVPGWYEAETQVPYTPGEAYHFRLVIRIPQRTYSIFVTPPGDSERTIGTDFLFRATAGAVTQLDHGHVWSGIGFAQACDFKMSECLVDGDCDDGLFCNGAEACVNGACEIGVAPCQADQCDETTDVCSVTFDADQDGDVDLGDFWLLSDCLGGPGVDPPSTALLGPAGCLATFDSDFDRDIDTADYGGFQVVMVRPVPGQPGDLDGDGDVDLIDYAGLANCLAGPGVSPTPSLPVRPDDCLAAFDYDADADVDLLDYAEFHRAFLASAAPIPGDFDGDGDVDLVDFAGLPDCLAGPGATPAPSLPTRPDDCLAAFDHDADADVDLRDFAVIQPAFVW